MLCLFFSSTEIASAQRSTVVAKKEVKQAGLRPMAIPRGSRMMSNAEVTVKGRYLFYNNCSFDDLSDYDAIAPDKEPLFDGATATKINYSSYLLGINGIVVDFESLNGEVDVDDFEFKVGNEDDSDSWSLAPAPVSIETDFGAGVEGSDRVTIIWPDSSIKLTWLQIRVLGNTTTKLAADDVFYFGNAVGETMNSDVDARVDADDVSAVRSNLSGFFNVDIENQYDVDRDGRVNATDVSIARNHLSGFFPLKLIQPSSSERPGIGFNRGVNFGNMLEAPNEGAWGLSVEERFFDLVVESGMDHIRLPISWTHHTSQTAPYAIDETFFSRVDWCVDQAVSRGLKIIVNVHHYDELNANPVTETPRAIAMWEQIATRYSGQPKSVYFEVLNEPHAAFNTNPALWGDYLAVALAKIRETNATRKVLVGGVSYNSIGGLLNLDPPDDPYLVGTFHFYEPFAFTHQGAEWVDPSPPVGTLWINDRVSFGSRWQSWSWNTTFTPTIGSLGIEYTEGWAGARFHATTPVADTDTLKFTIDAAMSLRVSLRDSDDVEVFVEDFQTTSGTNEYSFEFSSSLPISDITIQNLTPDAQPQFQLSNATLNGNDVTVPLLASEEDAIANAFLQAQIWSITHGVPIHLGEFGAYNPADIDSRVRWTTAVRDWSETLEIPFTYWEFGAGFGIYDPNGNAWRTPLIQSLVPEFTP
ncbi:cellulase family glycosylhydrolase [Mariniblastus fucicola]|nr:cellulase family glycosylhydrolase [Mariniblastus fucicola]